MQDQFIAFIILKPTLPILPIFFSAAITKRTYFCWCGEGL